LRCVTSVIDSVACGLIGPKFDLDVIIEYVSPEVLYVSPVCDRNGFSSLPISFYPSEDLIEVSGYF